MAEEVTALITITSTRQRCERWVAVDDVARHLGVAKDTIYCWIEDRGLPTHRVGWLWKFKPSEVDAWIERGGAGDDNQGPKPSTGGGT